MVDDTVLGIDGKSPYKFTWDTSSGSNGNHLLIANAKDKAGNTGNDSVTVFVENVEDTTPPSVVITSPGEGMTVSGNVAVLVRVGDDLGVVRVELYVDGSIKPESVATGGSFTTRWNANKITKGVHTLQCRAYDAAGNSSLSPPVRVYK